MTEGEDRGRRFRSDIWREIHRRIEGLTQDLSGELTEEDLKDLWYRRALELSRVPDHERERGDRVKLVTFRLGSDRYGVDIETVSEIQRAVGITPVPTAPDFVVGVVNLRGNILSVIDIRTFFALPAVEISEKSRILVVEGAGLRIGVVVERVEEITETGTDTMKPPLSLDKGITEDYVKGIVTLRGDMLIVVDMEKILSNPRLVVEESV